VSTMAAVAARRSSIIFKSSRRTLSACVGRRLSQVTPRSYEINPNEALHYIQLLRAT
jgi:hypothetical protein